MTSPRVWLITGASSGFGRAVTEVALANGEIVVATARSPSSLDDLVQQIPADRLLVLKCDVGVEEDVVAAFKSMYERFRRCDVVFNNAGYGYVAEVEREQNKEARRMFEANFWGAAHVSREAVHAFRDLNPPGEGGLLLTTTSMNGQIGAPGIGYYTASKHAIEGLTESLALEIDPKWNIKISMIEPSIFKTRSFEEGGMDLLTPPAAYVDPQLPAQQFRRMITAQALDYGDVNKAADKIYQFSKIASPPLRLLIGKPAITGIREKHKRVEDEIKQYESWSEGLELVD